MTNVVERRNQRRILMATFYSNVALAVFVTGLVAPAFALALGMAPESLISKLYSLDAWTVLYYFGFVIILTAFFYILGSFQLRKFE
jgi:hypothetical protein